MNRQNHPRVRSVCRCLLGLLFGAGLWLANADGMVVAPPEARARITIPAQSALLSWSNGVETLAIETRFVGQGTNFGWVVPLPAVPEIRAATRGLFPTLREQFQPKVIHNVTPWCLGAFSLAGLAILTRRGANATIRDALHDMLGCALLLSPLSWTHIPGVLIPISLLAGLLINEQRRLWTGLEIVCQAMLAAIILSLLGGMLLPALGTAGSEPTTEATGVRALASQSVGAYDTTTLTATDPGALHKWLDQHGYALPTNAQPHLAEYLQRGWVFMAARLRPQQETNVEKLVHPLIFTFKAEKPVYPMRLTTAGNGPLEVELFVLGPQMATAPGWRIERAVVAEYPSDSSFVPHRVSVSPFQIRHPLLRQCASGQPVATKLVFAGASQVEDSFLDWVPLKEQILTLYSYQGAAIRSLNWAVLPLIPLVLIAWWRQRRQAPWSRAFAKWVLGCVAVTVVIFSAAYFSVSTVPVTLHKRQRPLLRAVLLQGVGEQLRSDMKDLHAKGRPADLESAREALTQSIAPERWRKLQAPREEDSPGNYTLRQTTNGVEFRWYDAEGGEHLVDR